MARSIFAIVLALSLVSVAEAQCPGGVCPVGRRPTLVLTTPPAIRLPGRPVERAAKIAAVAVRGAAKVAVAPVRIVAKGPVRKAILQRQPVRRVLRAAAKVVTGRGPILSRIRGRCR